MSSPYSSLIDLGVLLEGNNGLSGSGALAMNDAGQVVGWSHALSNTALHAFIDSPP
jgi:probable HAF family extracellular repeat protein